MTIKLQQLLSVILMQKERKVVLIGMKLESSHDTEDENSDRIRQKNKELHLV